MKLGLPCHRKREFARIDTEHVLIQMQDSLCPPCSALRTVGQLQADRPRQRYPCLSQTVETRRDLGARASDATPGADHWLSEIGSLYDCRWSRNRSPPAESLWRFAS